MNEQNHDPFDILFQKSQVDLPNHLKRRLLSIPGTAHAVSFWDSRIIFPILAILPGLIWFFLTQSGSLLTWTGNFLGALSGALPAADSISVTAGTLYIGTGVLMLSAVTAAWIFFRQEQRAQIYHARQLTSAG